jgi:hypothetical protein
VKEGPPGWKPHQITHRIDGWVVDPENKDRIPAAIAELTPALCRSLAATRSVIFVRGCSPGSACTTKCSSATMNSSFPTPGGDVALVPRAAPVALVEGGQLIPSGELAAGVMSMNNKTAELEDEPDEYDEVLASLGRTEEQDQRVAIHEAGHAVCARLLGHQVGGVTVNPDPDRGSEGLCWGVGHTEAFAEDRGDASDVRGEALAPLMPNAGEDHSAVSDIFGNTYTQVIELMAGRAAERMLLDDEPVSAADDLRQARELALLFCKSEEAIETFIAHCDVAARDLLMPYGDVVIVLSTVLRIKRTLDGREIDQIILDVETRKALAIEQKRRADWRKSELAASRFRAECEQLDAARLPHLTSDRVR